MGSCGERIILRCFWCSHIFLLSFLGLKPRCSNIITLGFLLWFVFRFHFNIAPWISFLQRSHVQCLGIAQECREVDDGTAIHIWLDHKSGFLAGSLAFVKFHESGEEEGPLSKMFLRFIHSCIWNCRSEIADQQNNSSTCYTADYPLNCCYFFWG